MTLAIQSVWAWAVPVTVAGKGVRKRDAVSHVALDIGGFTVAFDTDHPVGRELIIAADLTAAENPLVFPVTEGGKYLLTPALPSSHRDPE